ncbi:M20/M25/M40 family metallo-hydrolase [Glycocaulis sp.]|uniref:M20/M25/M40 family metallo-hydrolase n=1 Tax=Glycocaulis sp. TaxID=1969725 RepID=UPI003F6F2222
MHFDLRFSALLAAPVLALSLASCDIMAISGGREPQPVTDLRILSADDMQGRLVGSEGNARARAYIVERLGEIGVEAVFENYEQSFTFQRSLDFRDPDAERETVTAVNLVGRIAGANPGEHVMVVGAHYDHVGMDEDGNIFNGADDNASGTAGLLAVAAAFMENPPENDVILVAFDAEEGGLRGARHFVANRPEGYEQIGFMLNMDMIAYSETDDLYAVGTWHYPVLLELVSAAAEVSPVNLRTGYDEPTDDPRNDWTMLSDHGPFHAAGIPFLYLGVEDHEHYHQITDTYENMTLAFFGGAVETSVDVARRADAMLDLIATSPSRQPEAVEK